jgi:hypothetical protein
MGRGFWGVVLGCVAVAAGVLVGFCGVAGAVVPVLGWGVDGFATPSSFVADGNAVCVSDVAANSLYPRCDTYEATVRDAGGGGSVGGGVTVSDVLPAGLSVQKVRLFWSGWPTSSELSFGRPGSQVDLSEAFGFCKAPVGGPVVCKVPDSEEFNELFGLPPGTFELPLVEPDQTIEMLVLVTVDDPGEDEQVENVVSVSGGGAPEVVSRLRNSVGGAAPGFGVTGFSVGLTGVDGLPFTQAAGHPYELTTKVDLANVLRVPPNHNENEPLATSVEDVKDVVTDLPVGFVGDADAAPTCTFAQLSSHIFDGVTGCPADTVVGRIRSEPAEGGSINGLLYNMAPEAGVPAEFGFADNLAGAHVIYTKVVPSPAGYVLQATATDLPQIALTDIELTLFGDPAAKDGGGETPVALFTNPSVCDGQGLVTSMYMDSWQHPARFEGDGAPDLTDPNWVKATSESPPVTGCNSLAFRPSLFSATPETGVADASTGLGFELRVPQSEEPETLATPPLRKAVVRLPAGLVVNPAAAGGLAACSAAQIGWLGGSQNNFTGTAPDCPAASKIGSVQVTTPLLAGTLVGSVYLAAENENPFGSLLAGYIVIDDPTTGVIAKLPGKLETDPSTGQITGVFEENPQLPFSDLKLKFFGGTTGGELATPESCASYTSTSSLSPWSAPFSGPEAGLSSPFSISTGCSPGFAPSFAAGVVSPRAGAYSPLVLSFSRNDSEQELGGLTVSLPPGLLARITGVALCPDSALEAARATSGAAETASPSCPEASQVATVQAGAGVGTEPFYLPGKAYLTGPYKGAPYGLAVIVPALAGPFDLGTVVIRQALQINPVTAQVTAVSDPFPTILDATGSNGGTDGFPIRLRSVQLTVSRPSFTVNPTSCDPMAITGTFTSTTGTLAPVASRLQVGGCQELPFKPTFTASTQAKTSKADGASLSVKVTSTPGQANIAKTRVTLPKQLPSRLTTLQKACTDAIFNANPAACPAASLVGSATASTPLLPAPLTGPAYLVSHGGAAFPDLEVVLQGNNVTLELDGITNIKKGITTSTFNSLPDAPITSFQLTLPQGPHSLLAAYLPTKAHGSTCNQNLTIPTTLTAQTGTTTTQQTKITTTNCPKHKPTKKHKTKHNTNTKPKHK